MPEEVIAATLDRRSPEDELAGALAVLRKRVPEQLADDRARHRAFGLLGRRGYAAEVAYEAIRRHGEALEASDSRY